MINTNTLINGNEYRELYSGVRTVDWTEPNLKITRIRCLSDDGHPMWDISYCHGTVGDERVIVDLPFRQLPKFRLKSEVIRLGKRDNVFAKGLGLLDFHNYSFLC